MTAESTRPSARRTELLEAVYKYALEHGLADLSLRPVAAAVGSSPRVLMFLFGNKVGLVRELLARARADELDMLERLRDSHHGEPVGLPAAVVQVWTWLAAEDHRALLRLWAEAYARSLVEPDGVWAGFARATVEDWLAVLATCQPESERDTPEGAARRRLALAVLRGGMLDILATGETDRVTAAVERVAADLDGGQPRTPQG